LGYKPGANVKITKVNRRLAYDYAYWQMFTVNQGIVWGEASGVFAVQVNYQKSYS
jgi:hypothetical protein